MDYCKTDSRYGSKVHLTAGTVVRVLESYKFPSGISDLLIDGLLQDRFPVWTDPRYGSKVHLTAGTVVRVLESYKFPSGISDLLIDGLLQDRFPVWTDSRYGSNKVHLAEGTVVRVLESCKFPSGIPDLIDGLLQDRFPFIVCPPIERHHGAAPRRLRPVIKPPRSAYLSAPAIFCAWELDRSVIGDTLVDRTTSGTSVVAHLYTAHDMKPLTRKCFHHMSSE
ncbi:hypothetical protein J6590_064225 [Homalodisca vitripennis]|nr:hypothetical protein J6590_064225 [Homalodisca vitripennis]